MDGNVWIDYTNHRGERRWREIVLRAIWYGSTSFYPETGWLVDALDVEKNADRTFSLYSIHGFSRTKPDPNAVRRELATKRIAFKVHRVERFRSTERGRVEIEFWDPDAAAVDDGGFPLSTHALGWLVDVDLSSELLTPGRQMVVTGVGLETITDLEALFR